MSNVSEQARREMRAELVADIERVRCHVRGRDYAKAVAILTAHRWDVAAALASVGVKVPKSPARVRSEGGI
jgi:hypothetical protein